MNRRAILTACFCAITPVTNAGSTPNSDAARLGDFIAAVIEDGDTSRLSEFVTVDVRIPDYNISGMDAFRAASDTAHTARQRQYTEYAFNVVAAARDGEWTVAYCRITGVAANGQATDNPVFYAARIVDGLIAELYL